MACTIACIVNQLHKFDFIWTLLRRPNTMLNLRSISFEALISHNFLKHLVVKPFTRKLDNDAWGLGVVGVAVKEYSIHGAQLWNPPYIFSLNNTFFPEKINWYKVSFVSILDPNSEKLHIKNEVNLSIGAYPHYDPTCQPLLSPHKKFPK